MKFIELFAGIGAFRLGLERTGHQCVWANEWLEKARSIYEYNFKDTADGKDIRDVSAGEFPNADLIVGGFPCATFSVAGKRTGFSMEDTRGTLAFEMFRLARDRNIPYILFENVKGLLNHDGGKTFEILLSALDEMGYDAQWELLDSENFGVPQHRERIFVIGHLRGKPRPKVFPIKRTAFENDKKNLTEKNFKVMQWRRGFFREYKGRGTPTLTANMGTGGHNVPFLDFSSENELKIRKLTPLECERLQGFPDNWTKYYKDGSLVPDSQRYERCGRSITISIVEEIGRRLHEFY